MVVLVLTACPAGLRGHLTRWLLEISAGVFVGRVSARVREHLWERVLELSREGRALLVYEVDGEQKLSFRVNRHHWEPVDYDGITLMRRPEQSGAAKPSGSTGWSKAGARKRFGRRKAAEGSASRPDEVNENQ